PGRYPVGSAPSGICATGGNVTLASNGCVTQTKGITANTLTLDNAGGAGSLPDALPIANAVSSLAAGASAAACHVKTVDFRQAGAFTETGAFANGNVTLKTLTSGNLTLTGNVCAGAGTLCLAATCAIGGAGTLTGGNLSL